MAKAFSSITITEVNDGQDGSILDWKGSYASVAKLIEAWGSPQNGWAYYDEGLKGSYIYQDGSWYLFSKDGLNGDAVTGIVDIRYSNDLDTKEFTANEAGEADGLTLGLYIGFRIVDVKPTLEELEGTFDEYSWSSIETSVEFNLSYYIDVFIAETGSNISIINQYLTKASTYEYSPEEVNVRFYAEANAQKIILSDDKYCFDIIYYYENGEQEYLYEKERIDNVPESIIFSETQKKIDQVNLILYEIFRETDAEGEVQTTYSIKTTETILGIYGMTKDMARLSIQADSIVQSIGETKLTFNNSGLTIANGAFKILNSKSEPIFYMHKEEESSDGGILVLKGAIEASQGEFGGWIIGQEDFHSETENIFFYSGTKKENNDKWLHNGSLIRILAGKKDASLLDSIDDPEETAYSFIVTDNGQLYGVNAEISGTIHATNGSIRKSFYVGEESSQDGIVIYGGGDTQGKTSYIGSKNFSSGTFGYGWNISGNGTAEFTDIRARGKIQSSVFEYQKTSSIGGNLYITPTIYFESKSSTITKNNNKYMVTLIYPSDDIKSASGRAWKQNDEIRLEGIAVQSGNSELQEPLNNITGFIAGILSDSGTKTTSITISFEYTGNIENFYLIEGTMLMFYGAYDPETEIIQQSGIYLTASDDNSPYIDIYDLTDETKYSPAVRLGNLTGVHNELFGTESGYLHGYGLYSSNAYLTGELILPNAGITNQELVGYDGDNQYTEGNSSNTIRIWAGSDKPKKGDPSVTVAPFIVTQDGSLYAKKGIFQGTVIAEKGYFNGIIQAAGIVLNSQSGISTSPLLGNDHFFVGYSENPTSYDDYVINIDKNGISIWEGALRAFSDFAGKLTNGGMTHTIYGYDKGQSYTPLPYFFLVDSAHNITSSSITLDSRIVAYKNHIFQLSHDTINGYTWSSVLLDNGIWFASGIAEDFILNDNLMDIENAAYSTTERIGIYEKENKLYISSNETTFEKGNVNLEGHLYLLNTISNDASIHIGNMVIKEVNKNTSGINIL